MSAQPSHIMSGAALKAAEAMSYFTEGTEIISLADNGAIQVASPANNQPGIAPPYAEVHYMGEVARQGMDSEWGHVLKIMRQGCYIRLGEHSGFPYILLRDRMWPHWWGKSNQNEHGSMANPRHDHRQVKITKRWTRIAPFSYPLLFPPTTRYRWGYGSAYALYPIGGWVTDQDSAYAAWPIEIEVRTLDNPPLAENDKWPTEYFLSTYKRLLTTGTSKTLRFPAMPVILSGDAATNVAYTGKLAGHGPTNLTNIILYTYMITYDVATLKGDISCAITGVKFNDINIPKDVITSRWWFLLIAANFDDPAEGDMPAKTDVEVTM